jgi:hypothetical protein
MLRRCRRLFLKLLKKKYDVKIPIDLVTRSVNGNCWPLLSKLVEFQLQFSQLVHESLHGCCLGAHGGLFVKQWWGERLFVV